MIELKPGVRVHGLRPEVLLAIHVAEGIWMAAGAPALVITGGIEGQHVPHSDHYDGSAVDLRSKNLPAGQGEAVVAKLKAALGPDYFVLLENAGGSNEHVHCVFRPAGPY